MRYDDYTREETKEGKGLDLGKLISKNKKINWEEVINLEETYKEKYFHCLKYLAFNKILQSESDKRGNFILFNERGMLLNPKGEFETQYGFIRKEDAEKYAKEKYCNEHFFVGLAKVIKRKVNYKV